MAFHSTETEIYEKIKLWKEKGVLIDNGLSLSTVFFSIIFAVVIYSAIARIQKTGFIGKHPDIDQYTIWALLLLLVIIPVILHKFFSTRLKLKNRILEQQHLQKLLNETTNYANALSMELESYKNILAVMLQDTKISAEILDDSVKKDESYRELRGRTLSMIERIEYFQSNRYHPPQKM